MLAQSPKVPRRDETRVSNELEYIFHIAVRRDWEAAQRVGEYRVSTIGSTVEEVGFIHGSFRHQVERVGSFRYLDVAEPVIVLVIDARRLSVPVRVENLDGGSELFPHIYGPLPVAAVVDTLPTRNDGERFVVSWDERR